MRGLIRELLDSGISSIFDPAPVSFKPEHERGVPLLRKLLKGSSSRIQKLPKKLTRNSFLLGCLDFTENEPIEHLIIGYGTKKGIGTDIYQIQHLIGNESSVEIPDSIIKSINTHSYSVPKSEVVIFHNHPYNWLNALFDNTPLPSAADRQTMLKKKYLEPFQLIRSLLKLGGVRFYLGENGFVREIRTPSLLRMLVSLD